MNNIRLVIFDLDGTLYDLKGLKWQMLLKFRFRLRTLLVTQRRRSRLAGQNTGSRDALLEQLTRQSPWLFPGTVSLRRWYENDFYHGFLTLLRARQARHGARELMDALLENGINIAVVSDYACVAERLHALNLLRNEILMVSCEEHGVLKPCRRPFEVALSHFNAEESQVLIVGDRDDTDGASAHMLGCQFFKVSDDRDFHLLRQAFSL